jgi:hypothetical protein
MGAPVAKVGTCCLCGTWGDLSFEHIPPRAAFNDHRVFEANVKKLIGTEWWDGSNSGVEGKWAQRGAGKETLCNRCNSNTGAWYGSAYVPWAQRGMQLLTASRGEISLAYPYSIYPLRVIKQIAVMFFSACGPSLRTKFRQLERFVLHREEQHWPSKLRVLLYMVHPIRSAGSRQSGMSGVLSFDVRRQHLFSEIAFPPFGYILSEDDVPIDTRLLDVTHFAKYKYKHKSTLHLKIPVLPVVSWLPADFRTQEEIQRTVTASPASSVT